MRHFLTLTTVLVLLFVFCTNQLTRAAEPRKTLTLKGRVEELVNNDNPTLPAPLKARALAWDEVPLDRLNRLAAALKSFPLTMRGEWRGPLTVKSAEVSNEFTSIWPEEASENASCITAGLIADANIRFFNPKPNLLTMDEPKVVLPVKRPDGRTRRIHFSTVQQLLNDRMSSLDGQHRCMAQVLKNEVTVLSANSAEQDIIVRVTAVNNKTQARRNYFAEHLFHFEKTAPFHLKTTIVSVEYGEDGRWWSKAVLSGDLN